MKGSVSLLPRFLCGHQLPTACPLQSLSVPRMENWSHGLGPERLTTLHWVLWHQGCSVPHMEVVLLVGSPVLSTSSGLPCPCPQATPATLL